MTASEPPQVSFEIPSVARIYDAALGGKDNFDVDRGALVSMEQEMPGILDLAKSNRAFLTRAVRYVAQLGVDQFLDLGSGLPTVENTHEIAQRTHPSARVLYVDNDPMVLAHGRALLADNPTTDVITADLREVDRVFASPEARRLLDPDSPVCLMAVSVAHCIPDADDPFGVLRAYMDRFPSGSALIYSHIVSDNAEARNWLTTKMNDEFGIEWGRVRTPEEAEQVADGLEVVPPMEGRPARFAECSTWRSGLEPVADARHNEGRQLWEHAAVAVKR
ncbi:hypothetical protein F4561_006071 [Lipingzhangella halophila]|uniref:S-adenosyl methyltransferase n=1 Tax=Lipingzhangella halophila TaxID=1783352 RepID=A0A7W7RNF2_9ACTN|nr:SAM-dependent methyltransferase [Lipingzhangella halophila]MBB4935177.1 hypothetical protein [Lipingzhangella halophila]